MELVYRVYCILHKTAKTFLGKNISTNDFLGGPPLELNLGVQSENAKDHWKKFIEGSEINEISQFNGLHHAGYISEISSWCLQSWVWTNAAIVKMYCMNGEVTKAQNLAGKLADLQQECGGWIVRYDYDKEGSIPMLAPNDSAYIANNAFLALYETTNDVVYLNIAIKCADWIIDTARQDGMVKVGYNLKQKKWETGNIVDTGFTAALFAKLFQITGQNEYKVFLINFVNKYIDLFYIPSKKGFSTSLDKYDKQKGGMFSRGQAWALEGLIPAYKVLQSEQIKAVLIETVETLLQRQLKNGAWPYNLTKPLLGEDCKGIPVIAKNLLDFNQLFPDERIILSSMNALNWCQKHTLSTGPANGGIFAFNMEGAVVYHHYTSTAFVYSSAYAIELYDELIK